MRPFEKWQQRLYSRAPLVGKLLRRQAVKALAQDGSPEAVKALTEVITHRDDEHLGFIALGALQQLAAQNSIEAQEALCRLVIDYDHTLAREVTITAQYAPCNLQQRALFYFLTEQWDRYEELDFDHTFLRRVYKSHCR
jgi:HEAT repeat protein